MVVVIGKFEFVHLGIEVGEVEMGLDEVWIEVDSGVITVDRKLEFAKVAENVCLSGVGGCVVGCVGEGLFDGAERLGGLAETGLANGEIVVGGD